MILHHTRYAKRFSDYGILIPIVESRSTKAFAAAVDDPGLGPLKNRWLVPDEPPPLSRDDLLRVHDTAYVDEFLSDTPDRIIQQVFELVDSNGRYYRYDPGRATAPLKGLAQAALTAAAGSAHCCRVALDEDFCYFLGGGTHHAMRAGGRGFCPLNDIVIAIRAMQAEGRVRTAWVVDVDAHKGDGTAELTLGDDSIRTLSVHMASGWPLSRPPLDADGNLHRPYYPSDVDIPIREGGDDRYVDALEQGLGLLETLTCGEKPDLVVVVAGADPYAGDVLPSTGGLELSLAQCLARDKLIYEFCEARSLPQAWLMSGGYGPDVWQVHAQFLVWALKRRLGL